MSTLLTAEFEASFAECSRALSLEAYKGQDGHSHQVNRLESDMMSEEFSSFQIRSFVSTVRLRDFSKCWPFRHKILEKCLNSGLKPFLPPFEPPLRGCDNKEEDHHISYSGLHQKLQRSAREDHFEESKQQDFTKFDRAESAVFNEKSPGGDKESKEDIGVEFSDRGSVETLSKGTPVLVKSCVVEEELSQAELTTVVENSQDGPSNDFATSPGAVHSCISPSDCVDRILVDEKMQGFVSLHAETITNLEKDSNLLISTCRESEAGSVLKDVSPSSSDDNDSSPRKAQTHHKLKLLPNECTIGEELASFHKSKSLKIGMAGKAHLDEPQLPSERLNISDQATALCAERDIAGLPSRSYRNVEDYNFTGVNLDILVPQVCPVCLNFTSTSNTALNAHIDHCLESVLPEEKGESRACKIRIKTRKMRSMADICATAPSRTLEDLERSSQTWALHEEASKEDSSCTLTWKSGLVRRQPRSSLHRGTAWKARNMSEVDDAPRVSASESQPQLDKAQQENFGTKREQKMLWTASRTPVGDTELELQQSCKDQQLFLEPGGPSHGASSIKLSLVRKKKKKQSKNIIFPKEVLTTEGHLALDEDQDDDMWSVPVNLLDFTLVDTSAEEEKRLQQRSTCTKGITAEAMEEQGSANDFMNRSGKNVAKQCSNGSPSVDLTENRPPNDVLKKQKRMQIDYDWNLDEVRAENITLSVHYERPAKHRRVAPKIKSLLTVVANSCKDNGKDSFESHGIQKKLCPSQWQEKTNDKVTLSAPSGWQTGHQEINFKRKSSTSMADEGHCEANKYVHFCPSEQPSTPDNLDSNNLPEHVKSAKGSSVSSGRALTEHEMYRDCPPTCLEEDFSLSISSEEFGNRNVPGEEILPLMSTLSKCQAGGKDSICALEARNIVNLKPIIGGLMGKAPPYTSNLSGLGENGLSRCRSRLEYLRRALLSVPSRKSCNVNKEEFSRNTSNVVSSRDQAGKSNLLAFTSCNASVSVSPFSNMVSKENAGSCVPQLPSGSRKSFFSSDAPNSQSVDNIRTNHMAYNSTAASNFLKSMNRDNQVSFANPPSLWSENSQLSACTRGAKFVKNNTTNGHSLTVAESSKNLGNCSLQCSADHSVQHTCFSASDAFERSGSYGNEISVSRKDVRILENGSLQAVNRMDQSQGQSKSTENLQNSVRASSCMTGVESPHQSHQEYLGSRLLSSELGPVHSSCLQENGHNYNCESNEVALPGISTERTSVPSSLLADLARTMSGSFVNARDPLPASNGFTGEYPRTSNTCFQCTPKNLNRARENLNLMPLQGNRKSCHPLASNGTVQPQLLRTALQTMKGHTPTINFEGAHHVGSNMDVSMKLCNTLSAVSPYRVDPSNSRESLLGGELTSSLNNYGTVEYSGDQGVVHIFGSPVFKLMGQNVIVTNSSIKTLGMESPCNQNGAQSFHPSSSTRQLGVFPESQNHFSHKLSQELFSSSHLDTWHGDACMQRSHTFLMDSLEINPQPLQNGAQAKSVHSKMLAYKEPAISKPQMPHCILGERSTILSVSREMIMKKPMVAHAKSKLPSEVFVDIPPEGGNSLSSAQRRGSGMATQQNDRQFTPTSCYLAPNEPLQSQSHILQSASALYLGAPHKLDVSGNNRYRSGTLADIVQSSERSNT